MSEGRPPGTLVAAWLIARKDLAIEFRSRTAFLSALVFAVLALCIFYFAWDPSVTAPSERAPGVLWVVLAFSALLGLQRSFGLEEHDRGIDALLVSPIAREAIYLGKAIGNLYDFTYALRAHKAGDEVLVKVLRGSQTIEAKVLLTERR